jgi:hypothetical protein
VVGGGLFDFVLGLRQYFYLCRKCPRNRTYILPPQWEGFMCRLRSGTPPTGLCFLTPGSNFEEGVWMTTKNDPRIETFGCLILLAPDPMELVRQLRPVITDRQWVLFSNFAFEETMRRRKQTREGIPPIERAAMN